MTTIDTLTTHQIETLRAEAAAAGDFRQVEICNVALTGQESARESVVAAIQGCEAASEAAWDEMADDGPVTDWYAQKH